MTTVDKAGTKLLTLAQAAAYLGRSAEAVSDAVRNGQLPSRKFGKRTYIPISALESWLSGSDPTEKPD
jgi:excisionase family DNA binding protein